MYAQMPSTTVVREMRLADSWASFRDEEIVNVSTLTERKIQAILNRAVVLPTVTPGARSKVDQTNYKFRTSALSNTGVDPQGTLDSPAHIQSNS